MTCLCEQSFVLIVYEMNHVIKDLDLNKMNHQKHRQNIDFLQDRHGTLNH